MSSTSLVAWHCLRNPSICIPPCVWKTETPQRSTHMETENQIKKELMHQIPHFFGGEVCEILMRFSSLVYSNQTNSNSQDTGKKRRVTCLKRKSKILSASKVAILLVVLFFVPMPPSKKGGKSEGLLPKDPPQKIHRNMDRYVNSSLQTAAFCLHFIIFI